MQTEIETKVLNINPQEIAQKLRELGAVETPEFLMRRYVFDMESSNIEWIRLRDEGDKNTMTYKNKEVGNTQIGKTIEIEVLVSDFDKTAQILSRMKFKKIIYQENKIWRFMLNETEFAIASWPLIKPFLEIESHNIENVHEGLKLLGLENKDSGDKDIKEIYMEEKSISLNDILDLRFS